MFPSPFDPTLFDPALQLLKADDGTWGAAERRRLLGVLHHYAGKREIAQDYFAEAVAADADDLLSGHYLVQSLSGTLAETAATRSLVLNNAVALTKAGETDPWPLYYAGHIFLYNGLVEGAVRCFGRCGEWLPALYMEVQVMHQIDVSMDLSSHIRYLLKEQQRQTKQGILGFLDGPSPLPGNENSPAWTRAIYHQAHTQEMIAGIILVRDWMDRQAV